MDVIGRDQQIRRVTASAVASKGTKRSRDTVSIDAETTSIGEVDGSVRTFPRDRDQQQNP